jgi:sulfate adenylyltransferase subunit 1 (EFTu-like GTPase family)
MRKDIAFLNDDLVFSSNGDLLINPSDEVHIEDTIKADVGWWKDNPIDGVGIIKWIGSPALKQKLQKKIQIELESDGYKVSNPFIKFEPNGQLLINPNATI